MESTEEWKKMRKYKENVSGGRDQETTQQVRVSVRQDEEPGFSSPAPT